MKDVSRRVVESIVEAEGAARAEFERALAEVEGADDAAEYIDTDMGPVNQRFAGVAVAPFTRLAPWLADSGYMRFDRTSSDVPTAVAFVHPEKNVLVTVQPAFGGVVTAGFIDMPTGKRREPRPTPAPDAGPRRGNGAETSFPMPGGGVH